MTRRAPLLLLIVLIVGPSTPGASQSTEAVSLPLWSGSTRASTFVTMADGTRLALDWWLPTGWKGSGVAPNRFPAVFRFTPYGRSYMDPKTGTIAVEAFFLERGYALVSADMRGTGASFGWMNLMDPRVRDDGKALVDWIAAQPWSDGTVGMRGGSYEGWSQLAVASKAPKALKAIVPSHPGWDGFLSHPGGIYSYAFLQMWTALTWNMNRNSAFAGFPFPPVPPVTDEDGDGQVSDEIPLDLNGNGRFADDYRWPISSGPAPRYADGVARTKHEYLAAVLQHIHDPAGAPGTFDGDPVTSPMKFWDTKRPGDGLTAPDLNWSWMPDVMNSKVPILSMAGWFDAFVNSSMAIYATARRTNPARLVARPSYHQGIGPSFAAAIGAEPDKGKQYLIDVEEQLRWFDHWLKGIDNGVEREPPVRLFVMNAGWRNEAMWPPAATTRTLYLDEGSALTERAPTASGSDQRRADFTAYSAWPPLQPMAPIAAVDSQIGVPVPAISAFGRNRQFMFLVPEGPPDRTELDKKGISYTSKPLSADVDVIGYPLVHIWASSTADDGDFFFYLEDVAPDGLAVLVTDYQHRAGFHTLRSPDDMIPDNPHIRVEPRTPWHGFREQDYDAKVFAGGKKAEIVTALYPTAWRFKAGHAVRLTITAADWPTFELNPLLSPSNRPDAPDNVVPTVTIHWGGKLLTRVELPVVP